MGWILNTLLEEVLEAPEKNTEELLSEKVLSLNTLDDAKLRALGEKGKEKKRRIRRRRIDEASRETRGEEIKIFL